jgi:hypothetical protein
MDYISIAEAAAKWGITRRRVQVLCNEGRIPGLTKFGKSLGYSQGTPRSQRMRGKQSPLNRKINYEIIAKKSFNKRCHSCYIPAYTNKSSTQN